MPPAFMAPPIGPTGPASVPTQNPGMMADALSQVREAVHILEMALPHLPVGSDEHKSVLKMITDGSKIAPASATPPGVQMTTLNNLRQHAESTSMLQQLLRNANQGGGSQVPGQPAPAGAPPTPQIPSMAG